MIQEVYIPHQDKIERDPRKSNFGAIKLEDGTVGVVYISLSPKIKEVGENTDLTQFKGMSPLDLAKEFTSSDNFQKTLGLGAINAISQYIFQKSNFSLDFTTDSLGLLQLNYADKPGMVGFFPPLVAQIKKMGLDLIVIEKKANLVQKTNNWEVTLDPARLEACNKILITSTTILNESIDDILKFCSNAEKISIIGPTAGFFPDPLFSRGVDIVGGTYIHDSNLFMELISKNERWGPSTKKYCIQKSEYPEITALLNRIKK
ncbi:MAG: Rossmann-like domain-containing protein [Promethearchaeota archaeon]